MLMLLTQEPHFETTILWQCSQVWLHIRIFWRELKKKNNTVPELHSKEIKLRSLRVVVFNEKKKSTTTITLVILMCSWGWTLLFYTNSKWRTGVLNKRASLLGGQTKPVTTSQEMWVRECVSYSNVLTVKSWMVNLRCCWSKKLPRDSLNHILISKEFHEGIHEETGSGQARDEKGRYIDETKKGKRGWRTHIH